MELIPVFILLWLISAIVAGLGCVLACRNAKYKGMNKDEGFYYFLGGLCLIPILNTFWAVAVVVMLSLGAWDEI